MPTLDPGVSTGNSHNHPNSVRCFVEEETDTRVTCPVITTLPLREKTPLAPLASPFISYDEGGLPSRGNPGRFFRDPHPYPIPFPLSASIFSNDCVTRDLDCAQCPGFYAPSHAFWFADSRLQQQKCTINRSNAGRSSGKNG